MAEYDAPAFIDYVLKETKLEKISWIRSHERLFTVKPKTVAIGLHRSLAYALAWTCLENNESTKRFN